MKAVTFLFAAAVALAVQVLGKDSNSSEEWTDVVECFRILTNQTALSHSTGQFPAADVTRELFKAVCRFLRHCFKKYQGCRGLVFLNNQVGELFLTTAGVRQGWSLSKVLFNIYLEKFMQDQFLECVDKTLSKAQGTSVLQHFRPLFNVSVVTEAYNDLCSNDTVTQGDEDLSCLVNQTALLPCYTEYYNYLFYLSVVKRFGSQERQLPDDVVNTLLCTLAEERRDCEVAALSKCSTKVGEVMQSFYQKTLPAVCQEDESDFKSRSEVSTPSDATPTSG